MIPDLATKRCRIPSCPGKLLSHDICPFWCSIIPLVSGGRSDLEKRGKCYTKHEAVQNALKEHRSGRMHLVASITAEFPIQSANTKITKIVSVFYGNGFLSPGGTCLLGVRSPGFQLWVYWAWKGIAGCGL